MKSEDRPVDKPPVQATTRGYKTFEDLLAYQVAREFRKAMCGLTRRLPAFEKFELASQIRRASVSLTNNIAERKQGSSLALHESSPACGLTEDELDAILSGPEAEAFPPASTLQRFNPSTNP